MIYKIVENNDKLTEDEVNKICNEYNCIFIDYIINKNNVDYKYIYIFTYENSAYKTILPELNDKNVLKYSDLYKNVDLTFEEWKDIPSYEGIYKVSNMGRIKSVGNDKTRRDKILSPGKDGGGYWKYNMCKNGTSISEKIHRLVAKSFIHDIPEGYHVDHINTNINDNRVTNLRIVTAKENANNDLTRLKRKK